MLFKSIYSSLFPLGILMFSFAIRFEIVTHLKRNRRDSRNKMFSLLLVNLFIHYMLYQRWNHYIFIVENGSVSNYYSLAYL
jgi:hypothetical protein